MMCDNNILIEFRLRLPLRALNTVKLVNAHYDYCKSVSSMNHIYEIADIHARTNWSSIWHHFFVRSNRISLQIVFFSFLICETSVLRRSKLAIKNWVLSTVDIGPYIFHIAHTHVGFVLICVCRFSGSNWAQSPSADDQHTSTGNISKPDTYIIEINYVRVNIVN